MAFFFVFVIRGVLFIIISACVCGLPLGIGFEFLGSFVSGVCCDLLPLTVLSVACQSLGFF